MGTALPVEMRRGFRRFLRTPSDRESLMQVWRARIRFRQELWRLLRDSPALIEDIGLTVEQAKEEIAKPFWHRSCERLSRKDASLAQRLNEPAIGAVIA